jgi:hypothetical protein
MNWPRQRTGWGSEAWVKGDVVGAPCDAGSTICTTRGSPGCLKGVIERTRNKLAPYYRLLGF